MTYTREQEQEAVFDLSQQGYFRWQHILDSVIAERDRLGEALYAAYVATGADTDGAADWEHLFRPITHPSWVEVMRQEVGQIRDDADRDLARAEAERDRAVACIRDMEEELAGEWLGSAARVHGALQVLAEYDKETEK